MPPIGLRGYLAIGKLVALLGAIALICWQSSQIHRWHAHSNQCSDARHADQQSYAEAQREAKVKNDADVARDKATRERITHDISQSYEAQLASLRADLARRLRSPNPAAPGASGSSGLPDVSPAPSGPDGGSRVSIPPSLYVRGAELELQLEQLQQWVNKQLAVNPNER